MLSPINKDIEILKMRNPQIWSSIFNDEMEKMKGKPYRDLERAYRHAENKFICQMQGLK